MFQISTTYIVILLLLYIFSSINGVVYYTYVWQLKEYRLDRMLDAFRTKTGRQRVFPVFQVVKMLIFGIAMLHHIFVKDIEIFYFYALAALALEFLDLLIRIIQHRVYRPKKTMKAVLIMALTFGLMLVCAGAVWVFVPDRQFGVYALVLSLVVGDVTSIIVWCVNPITERVKKKIIERAKRKIASKKLVVIGITGSYGKSSTKEFLYQILEYAYPGKVFKTPGNTNVDIGVAQVVLQDLMSDHKFAIIEMGAYKKGEISSICDIVQPDIGIITAVADQHLALFGSLKNIQDAKYELIESLGSGGVAFFNTDSPGAKELSVRAEGHLQLKSSNIRTYACQGTAKMMALHVEVGMKQIDFDIHGIKFTAPVYGKQNLPNLLAAIAVAKECGMTFQEISKAVREIQMPEKIMHLKESASQGGDVLVIDDSYNSNPDGVIAALEYLESFKGYRKILVFPGMLELGPRTDSEHIRVAEKIRQVCDFAIITSRDFVKPLKIGFKDYEAWGLSDSPSQTQGLIQKYMGEKTVILFEQRGAEKVIQELLM